MFQCWPLNGTWYMVKRNYESDPAFGGDAKCVMADGTGPVVNDVIPLHYKYGKDCM